MQKINKSLLTNIFLTGSGFVFIFFLCLPVNGQAAAAQGGKSDPRVAAALKETNTQFEISPSDGGYKITYGTKGNRTQLTHVASGTEMLNGAEMRLIFSIAMISKTLPTQQTANMLLQENMERIGSWGLQKLDDGNYAIVNILYISGAAGGKQLESNLMAIATVADEMEEKLTKKDVN